jgi:hypothetical protein
VLSKLPIGRVTSWQKAVHPSDPTQPVFSRDLLEVEILNATRSKKLFTLFVNHLKSHFVPFDQDPLLGAQKANAERQRQAEMAAQIIASEMRPNSSFVVVGDMNDAPTTPFLAPLVADKALGLVDALAAATETRAAPKDTPPPASPVWTNRFKETGKPADYELFDQIWLSPALAGTLTDARIDRRTKLGGDGSDHDPAWITLTL